MPTFVEAGPALISCDPQKGNELGRVHGTTGHGFPPMLKPAGRSPAKPLTSPFEVIIPDDGLIPGEGRWACSAADFWSCHRFSVRCRWSLRR